MPRRVAVLPIAAALLVAAGCAAKSDAGSGSSYAPLTGATSAAGPAPASATTAAANPCAPGQLKVKSRGSLTVATDSPAYAP